MNKKDNSTLDPPDRGSVLALPCHKLADHPLRLAYYHQGHLNSLTHSIRVSGLLEPILVQPLEEGSYQILNGHYRVRAVRQLRQKTILGHVYPCDPRTALIIFCTANLLTKALSALEEAMMMQGLIREGGFSLAEVGDLWGHSKSWVSRRLKLLTGLDLTVKRALDEGQLRPRLAQELARLPQGNDQSRVMALVRRLYLTKDQTAHLIDWWQEATEEERLQLEKKGKLPPTVSPRTLSVDPGHYTAELLRRSTLSVDELANFLNHLQPPFPWWPHSTYQTFMQAVQGLATLAPRKS
ncbi:ParB-like nuclease domain protein [Acididesulfobacillus acetoxydans]|uniref:ParB-like nuclease domain protein n=1 Tax=Acididesulfobacillus acetoxydans TaxID=1561005 RepID=A0A8S0W812_9FIRM|nr:ParB/RepB/Spo0J family partition protein [Acididesulfobacillus acetoxydans]CAA7601369.1 ParB-like nuclease domain protein [Acididesulfobacillus acetoxydans]CEJ07185.1 ParB/Sulfiredoxin [Acididesulfobacillus acetoxydans]